MSGSNSSPAWGWSRLSLQARRQLRRISARARSSTASSVVFSQSTKSSRMRNSRCRSAAYAASLPISSGTAEGSSTICAKITARAVAKGRRAHHRCSVDGCPCPMDFSRAAALLMASSGNATSMSYLRVFTGLPTASSRSACGSGCSLDWALNAVSSLVNEGVRPSCGH